MALPPAVIDAVNESAQRAGVEPPKEEDDLFRLGVLDSFALIDFIALIEDSCGLKVPDSDVVPANFQSLATIGKYIESHKG
jgi:acyl carrier protein